MAAARAESGRLATSRGESCGQWSAGRRYASGGGRGAGAMAGNIYLQRRHGRLDGCDVPLDRFRNVRLKLDPVEDLPQARGPSADLVQSNFQRLRDSNCALSMRLLGAPSQTRARGTFRTFVGGNPRFPIADPPSIIDTSVNVASSGISVKSGISRPSIPPASGGCHGRMILHANLRCKRGFRGLSAGAAPC